MPRRDPRIAELKGILYQYSTAILGPDAAEFTNDEIADMLADIDRVDRLRHHVRWLAAILDPTLYRNPVSGKETVTFIRARYPELWQKLQAVLRNQ